MEETKLTEGLVALARACGKSDEDRARASRALRAALAEVEGRGFERARIEGLVTARTANAMAGLAAALNMAADHASCIADQARIIAPPPEHR